MHTISRRKLATHFSTRLARGDESSDVVNELAAYLVDTRRTKESGLITRDIESELAAHGAIIGTLTSARALSSEADGVITQYIKSHVPGTKSVSLRHVIDESVIGGVRLELPGAQLDTTIKTTLETLTTK